HSSHHESTTPGTHPLPLHDALPISGPIESAAIGRDCPLETEHRVPAVVLRSDVPTGIGCDHSGTETATRPRTSGRRLLGRVFEIAGRHAGPVWSDVRGHSKGRG